MDKGYQNTETSYPLLPNNRTWTSGQLLLVSISTAVATWCFLQGGLVGNYLNVKMGIATYFAGCMFMMFVVSLSIVPVASKYGIDSVTSSKPFLGNRGWVFALVLQYVSIIGWNSTLLIFFAKSANMMLVESNIVSDSVSKILLPTLSFLAVLLIWFILRKGSKAVQKVSVVIAFTIVAVGLWMLYMIIQNFGFDAIGSAEPSFASPSKLWNYAIGIEIGFISITVWWPYIGGIFRLSPKVNQTTLPSMIGLGFAVPVMATVGLLSILLLGDPDPTVWIANLGGPLYGSIALLFIALANFGSAVMGVYACSVGLKNFKFIREKTWNVAILFSIIPMAFIGIFIPEWFFNHFGTFLTVFGVFIAPVIGIQIVDYFILRNKRINIYSLYEESESSDYSFWKGWNPAALVALPVGFICYLVLLNPITYESITVFKYTTATLPSIIIGGIVYWWVSKVYVIPNGQGGYKSETNDYNRKL